MAMSIDEGTDRVIVDYTLLDVPKLHLLAIAGEWRVRAEAVAELVRRLTERA